MTSLWRFLVRALAMIGGLVLLLIVISVVMGVVFHSKGERAVPDKVILELDLKKEIPEYISEDPIANLMADRAITVRDTVETLQRAADDPRVVGLVGKIGAPGMGMGKMQEIRNAVIAFRAKGKPAIAFAETFGEFGPGNGAYYIATAFEQIYLQPSGDLGLTGIMIQSPFVRGTLEKLGITPRLDHRGKYKTAMNTFTERGFTEADREATRKMMESQFAQMVQGIATSRGYSPDEVRGMINRGPFFAEEALRLKLVDGLAYRDEVHDIARERAGRGSDFFSFSRYVARTRDQEKEEGKAIALIYGVGAVHRGKSDYSPLFGGSSMGSETISAAFRAAVEDSDVKAILFRVDSPGGSYVASDTIWRETARAKKAGKPIIVSMGNVAASGGYFVSLKADKIVAQPGTLTASIGVFAGKPLMTDFWNKIGVTWEELHTSDNATFWSRIVDYTPEQWALFERWLDRVYDDFTTKVAEGRNIPKEKVLNVAQGRVWTGEDAKELGLVDELGGFPEAIRLAREAARIPEGGKHHLKLFPRKKTLLESVSDMLLDDNGEADAGEESLSSAVARAVRSVRPLVKAAAQIGLGSEPDVLMMPEVDTVR